MKANLIQRISLRTGISAQTLLEIVSNSENEYSKREVIINGKRRIFYVPSFKLKLIQYYIIDLIFNKIPVSEQAQAYVKGKSIKTNVLSHAGSLFFYQTDIVSFFPSISRKMIEAELRKLINDKKIVEEDVDVILKVVCPFGHLDLGSPSSPVISNIVMRSFDKEMTLELKRMNANIVYTRYSDDITISSKNELNEALDDLVELTLKRYGFTKNVSKTKRTRINDNIKITGIFLNESGLVTVGTAYKKRLKHFLHLLRSGKEVDIQKDQVLGMLSFLRDIEPDYYQKVVIKYSDNKTSLIDFLKNDD